MKTQTQTTNAPIQTISAHVLTNRRNFYWTVEPIEILVRESVAHRIDFSTDCLPGVCSVQTRLHQNGDVLVSVYLDDNQIGYGAISQGKAVLEGVNAATGNTVRYWAKQENFLVIAAAQLMEYAVIAS